jgi:uncharacterized protein with HEPN domain
MRAMRHESLYLSDIVEAADYIAGIDLAGIDLAGIDYDTFEKSELLRSAVVQKLAMIGEAASRVSEDLK